jgi:hypothetical protein
MKPDIGKLDVFPSIWGREYFALSSFVAFLIQSNIEIQTGQEGLEIAKKMLNGWTDNWQDSLPRINQIGLLRWLRN